MGVASIAGLLIPATDEGSVAEVVVRSRDRRRLPRRGAGASSIRARASWGAPAPGTRTSALVFARPLRPQPARGPRRRHRLRLRPAGLSLFVILAIAIQNIPEGTSVAIPMAEAGFSRVAPVLGGGRNQRPAAGRCAGRLLRGRAGQQPCCPFSFAFAAGAMLALIVVELLPQAYAGPQTARPERRHRRGRGGDARAEPRPRRLRRRSDLQEREDAEGEDRDGDHGEGDPGDASGRCGRGRGRPSARGRGRASA